MRNMRKLVEIRRVETFPSEERGCAGVEGGKVQLVGGIKVKCR